MVSCSFGQIFWSPLSEWCTMGMMTLSTQAEVDAFHCSEVGDILKISGPDITDLRPLARLRKVGQKFIIEKNKHSSTHLLDKYVI